MFPSGTPPALEALESIVSYHGALVRSDTVNLEETSLTLQLSSFVVSFVLLCFVTGPSQQPEVGLPSENTNVLNVCSF